MIAFICIMAMPYDQNTTESSISIEHCQCIENYFSNCCCLFFFEIGENGRVCMNICYYNGQQINCTERNVLKSVLFNPPFGEILPSINLRLIQIDTK